MAEAHRWNALGASDEIEKLLATWINLIMDHKSGRNIHIPSRTVWGRHLSVAYLEFELGGCAC